MDKKNNAMISMRIPISVLICLTAIAIQGCSIFYVPQMRNGETANQCLNRIADTNDLLVSCKGIAKISSIGFEYQINERIAFIAQKMHRLRAEMLTPFGVIGSPFKLICTNDQIYLNSQFLDQPIYTRPGTFLLTQALPIKIQPHELIALLHGQIPFDNQMNATYDRLSNQKTLLLSKGMIKKTRQKIIFDHTETHVRSFEKYNYFNALVYRLTFDQYKTYNNFTIPSTVTISNADNQRIIIDMQSYYPNCAIKKHSFDIDHPKHVNNGGFPCAFNPFQRLLNLF